MQQFATGTWFPWQLPRELANRLVSKQNHPFKLNGKLSKKYIHFSTMSLKSSRIFGLSWPLVVNPSGPRAIHVWCPYYPRCPSRTVDRCCCWTLAFCWTTILYPAVIITLHHTSVLLEVWDSLKNVERYSVVGCEWPNCTCLCVCACVRGWLVFAEVQEEVRITLDCSQATFIASDKMVISLKGGEMWVKLLLSHGKQHISL